VKTVLSFAVMIFPRSIERGLIEASSRLPFQMDHWAHFRVRLNAASLKQVEGRRLLGRLDAHFRVRLNAASLKQR